MRTHYGGTIDEKKPFSTGPRSRTNDTGKAEVDFVKALFPPNTLDSDIALTVQSDLGLGTSGNLSGTQLFMWATGRNMDGNSNDGVLKQFVTLTPSERDDAISACNNIVTVRRRIQGQYPAGNDEHRSHQTCIDKKNQQCYYLRQLHNLIIADDEESQKHSGTIDEREEVLRKAVVDDMLDKRMELERKWGGLPTEVPSHDKVLEVYHQILDKKGNRLRLLPASDSQYMTPESTVDMWNRTIRQASPGSELEIPSPSHYPSPSYSGSTPLSDKAARNKTLNQLAAKFPNQLFSPSQYSTFIMRLSELGKKEKELRENSVKTSLKQSVRNEARRHLEEVEKLIVKLKSNASLYSDPKTKSIEEGNATYDFDSNELRIAGGGTVSGEGTSRLSPEERAIRKLKKKIISILTNQGNITEPNKLIISDLAEKYISTPDIFSGENVDPEIKKTLVAEYNDSLSQQPDYVDEFGSGDEGADADGMGGGKPKRRKGNKTRKGNKRTNTNKTKKHKGRKTHKRKYK